MLYEDPTPQLKVVLDLSKEMGISCDIILGFGAIERYVKSASFQATR